MVRNDALDLPPDDVLAPMESLLGENFDVSFASLFENYLFSVT
jgi:hypothetical protein